MSIYSQLPEPLQDGKALPDLPLSPLRRELLQWLIKEAPALAPAYEGALWLLEHKSLPGRTQFISHAVRDISDRLPYALNSDLAGRRVQYETHLDGIEKHWPSLDHLFQDERKPAESESVGIPFSVTRQVNVLVLAHRQRKKGPSNSQLLFQELLKRDPSKGAASDRHVAAFKEIREWFMDRTHFRAFDAVEVPENDLVDRFGAFEKTIHNFVGNFFTAKDQLDAILQAANQ